MSTNAPGVRDATLQRLIDAIIDCIKRPDGTFPDAAPNAFKDSKENTVPVMGAAFVLSIAISENGSFAMAQVSPPSCAADSIVGELDTAKLATKLAG